MASSTTRWVWEPDRVVLVFSNYTIPGLVSFDCAYTPPPEVVPIPLRAVALPVQSWSGAQCSGTAQVTVVDEEPVVAAGRRWDTWQIHSVLRYQAGSSVDVTLDTTDWVSPELGTWVASKETMAGNVVGAPLASEQVTRLTALPP
jgi:hypothetical protein